MDVDLSKLPAKQRLELTRRAIAGQLARKRGGTIHTAEEAFVAEPVDPDSGMLASTRRAASAWWQTHPLHNAVDLARPLLEDYAQHKPLQLVGVAAGTGAALTLLKSWRVLSLTGVVLALVKTSDVKSTARYFMGRRTMSETLAPTPPAV